MWLKPIFIFVSVIVMVGSETGNSLTNTNEYSLKRHEQLVMNQKCDRLEKNINISLNYEWCSLLSRWEGTKDSVLLQESRHWIMWDPERPPSQTWQLCFGGWAFLVTTFGVVGNIMVVFLFARNKTLRFDRIYKISLGISDLIASLITYLLVVSSIIRIWPFGKFMCQLYAYLHCTCGLVSILTLALIAASRASAILVSPRVTRDQPVGKSTLLHRIRQKYTKFGISVVSWVICAGLSLPPLLGIGRYSLSGYLTTCCFDAINPDYNAKIFFAILFTIGFLCPFLVIVISYAVILRALYRNHKRLEALNKLEALKREDALRANKAPPPPIRSVLKRINHRQELNEENEDHKDGPTVKKLRVRWENANFLQIAGTTTLLIVCYIISWLPYGILSLSGILCTTEECHRSWIFSPTNAMIAALCAKSATIYNPIIYGVLDAQFIRELQLLFGYIAPRYSSGRSSDDMDAMLIVDVCRTPDTQKCAESMQGESEKCERPIINLYPDENADTSSQISQTFETCIETNNVDECESLELSPLNLSKATEFSSNLG